jgi:hypothetical protein
MTQGHKYGQYIADILEQQDISCIVPELYIVKSREEIPHMTQTEKDIIIEKTGDCLEVKSRNIEFTSIDDFPWGNIIVDTVSGYEAKLQKPLAYVMVSQLTGCAFAVMTNSYKHWTTKRLNDKQRGHDDNFYVVTKEHFESFDYLVDYIKREEDRWNFL